MKKKVVKFNYKGVEYEVIPFNSCFSCCMEVDIREVVRPDKKWFRTKSVDNRAFFIDDYNTIEEACKSMLMKYLEENRIKQERINKVKRFLEN